MNNIKNLDCNEIKMIEFKGSGRKCIFRNSIFRIMLYETLDSKIIDAIKNTKSGIASQIKE